MTVLRDEDQCTSTPTAIPFVHKVATEGGKYIFDVNTGEILRVDEVIWEILEDSYLSEAEVIARHTPRFTPAQIAEAYREISKVRAEKGYFLNDHPTVGLAVSRENVHDELMHGRSQLILEATERCNFGCTYCQRNFLAPGAVHHGARDMDWGTARAAIDDFLQHCRSPEPRNQDDGYSPDGAPIRSEPHNFAADAAYVSFYGGEPLLNFPLIKKCTEYVLKKAKGRKVYFALSTNGYLLEGERAEYLAAHNFLVTVSLDGPASCHDRHRRTKEGMPTHGVVLDHFRAFVSRCPTQGGINAVLARGTDVREVCRYFNSADWMPPGTYIRMAPASPPYPEYDRPSPRAADFPGLREMHREFIERLIKGQIPPGDESREVSLVRDMLFDEYKKWHQLRWNVARRKEEPYTPVGPCMAGIPRLYVSVAGDYYPCEKVLCREEYRIGSATAGVDEERVYNLLRGFVECNLQECERCWCLPLCSVGCYATVWDRNGFSADVKKRACENGRKAVHQSLKDYCSVLEQNPRAFDLFIKPDAVPA